MKNLNATPIVQVVTLLDIFYNVEVCDVDYDGFPVPEIENEGICSQIAKIPHQGEVNRLITLLIQTQSFIYRYRHPSNTKQLWPR